MYPRFGEGNGAPTPGRRIKPSWAILIVLFLSLTISCESDNKSFDPFDNGGNERNLIVVISDLHLGADLTYAEFNANSIALEKFLAKIRAAQSIKELVIAGDLFDEWFVPADVDTYKGKDQRDFVQRIAAANKSVIDAFNRIIQDGEITVTYVPGNHDLTVISENVAAVFPGIKQARDEELGLGTYSPTDHPEIAIEHGHRYNFFCAPDPISNKAVAPGSIMPPGYFFTRIATLHVVQKCKTAGEKVPVISQNASGDESQKLLYYYWNVWNQLMTELPIENKLSEKIIVTGVNGFTEKYSINDLLPYQVTAGGAIDVKLFKGIQDTWDERQRLNHVAVSIPAEQAILGSASEDESENQAQIQYFMNPDSNKRIVVFGHTHGAKIVSSESYKGEKTIYVNSGTWIDHNPDATTRNFVVIAPQSADASSETSVNVYKIENDQAINIASDSLRL
jgi:UDP-2,3-diacylglucosamine pyrophosphatase LpxH